LEADWTSIRNQLEEFCKISNSDIFKRLNKLKKNYIFKHLSESRILEICNGMIKEKYKPGEHIFFENTKGDKFYLLNKGRVKVVKGDKVIRELEEGSCFGELSLLNEEKRTASVVAIDKVNCYVLKKEKFLDLIDEKVMDFLKTKMCLEDTEMKISNLFYLSFIGRGKYGNVYLVHNCIYLYALKCIPRKLVDKQKSLVKYILSEKSLMLSIEHPFIVKLVKTLKNETHLIFAMEFINGINMDDYLTNRKSKKNSSEAKFYTASLLLILDYLNSKYIAHRDIKPSNIMIDKNGYLKLIDFGTAKKVTDFTHTIIGTPHFMAPEILQGKGYQLSCDFWSVGVTMYYIFYGNLPFGQNSTDVMDIYKEIMHK
jgi:cGMP-dependent protein kinase